MGYRIFSAVDGTFRMHENLRFGEPIPCRICGGTEDWIPEGDTSYDVNGIRSFVCEHEWEDGGVGMRPRQIDSFPATKLYSWEPVELMKCSEDESVWVAEWSDLWKRSE